jgi:glycerophosphoryl diester phosphodiesterase
MDILTHRGLDSSRSGYFAESSYEAFEDQLARGFGLEFDPQLTADGKIVVWHNPDLQGAAGVRLASLSELLREIGKMDSTHPISALHLKRAWHAKEYLDPLLRELEGADRGRFIIFDVLPDVARYLKDYDKDLMLAPSVAHPYDIERYNGAVGGTLVTAEAAREHRDLFDWVWLDEWDRKSPHGVKALYTSETFSFFRDAGFKIALVSPELHATSPGLLGGERHEDAKDVATLRTRLAEIITLGPDAICTDYPDLVKTLS